MIRIQSLSRIHFRMLALLAVFACGAVRAQSVQDLVRETQVSTTTDGQITMIWWMPNQFWDLSLKGNPAVPAAAREQLLATLSDYMLVAVLRANAGASGLGDVRPKDELLKNLRVEVNGKRIEPMPPDQVAPAAQIMLSQLKPVMASVIGQVGQSMEFVVYPSKVDGKPIDVAAAGSVQISLYDQQLKVRLPLGSLLPPKKDAKTGESFPGNYEFNPYTGAKLPAPKP
jgi:hypothetical protein